MASKGLLETLKKKRLIKNSLNHNYFSYTGNFREIINSIGFIMSKIIILLCLLGTFWIGTFPIENKIKCF